MTDDIDDRDRLLEQVHRRWVRASRTRRVHPTVFHLGRPDGEHVRFVDDPLLDAGLRRDLLELALEDVEPATALAWMTRGGALSPGDADFAWLCATRDALGRHGHDLDGFWIVTRSGWSDLISDRTVHRS